MSPDILVNMSQTQDKRHRSDLDLFVLALIESKVSTPYDLQRIAGLSPGATIPSLRRLVGQRFVAVGEAGPRGRIDYAITADGRKHLKTAWQALIDDGPSGDLDADLRVALLVLWVGGDRRLAKNFLRQSAARNMKSAGSVKEPEDSDSFPPLALWYRQLRAASAEVLMKGESAAALAMAKALPRKQGRKRNKNRD
jgi:DNA-binding PadR family transcriptional regulator